MGSGLEKRGCGKDCVRFDRAPARKNLRVFRDRKASDLEKRGCGKDRIGRREVLSGIFGFSGTRRRRAS